MEREAPVVKSPVPVLDGLRVDIDEVDQGILQLLAKRVSLVLRVGEYKRQSGLPVYDPARERSVLERLSSTAPSPLDRDTVHRVFERVIDECRRIEQHHVQQR